MRQSTLVAFFNIWFGLFGMRTPSRWYTPLLTQSIGTTSFVRERYPTCKFRIEKRIIHHNKMVRHIRFVVGGKTVVHARAEVDLVHSNPRVVELLRDTETPMGQIVESFNVRRTRLRSTTRTREFHFIGDLEAKVWERFYVLPKSTIVPAPERPFIKEKPQVHYAQNQSALVQ